MHNKQLESAHGGDNIGINIKGFDKALPPKRGDVMFLASEKPCEVYEFTAQIHIQDHPGELKVGYSPNITVKTAAAACRMQSINWRLGKETNKTKAVASDPTQADLCKMIKQGDAAEVVFRPQKPLYLEKFDSCEGLARICLMDSSKLVALGKVTDVKYYTPELKAKLAAEAKAAADAKRATMQKKKK
jgi:elongation factor 1-alpha